MFVAYVLLVLGALSFGDACQCGEPDCLTTSVPTIFESPNHPNNHDNHEDCTLTVTPPDDKCVQLTYLTFNLEHGWDFLYIYGDGDLLVQRTGRYTICTPSVLDSYSQVELHFTSDLSITRPGFQIDIDFVDCPGPVAPVAPVTYDFPTCSCESGCGTITQSTTVTSPNFPNEYPNDVECEFTVQPPDGQCYSVEFSSFDTEAGWDYLTVYDESGNDEIHEIHGEHSTLAFHQLLQNLYFEFTSDGSVTEQGFEMNIIISSDCDFTESVVHNCDPEEFITSGPTLVTSNYHPFEHSNHIECSVYINPPPETSAELDFHEIDLEVNYDFLYIYENGVEVAEINGAFCDYPTYVGGVNSPIEVHFDSDFSVTNDGFSYTVSFIYTNCPTGFTEHIPGKCYKIVPDVSVNQADAKTACEATYGAKLFYYESVEEFTTIRKMIKYSEEYKTTPRFWMGLVRENISSTSWSWGMNGDIIAAADLVFGTGEPNNKAGNEVCMNMLKLRGFKLNDANCDKLGGYVCKVNLTG